MNEQFIQRSILRTAKRRLAEHKNLGHKSSLSIYEVAELHDILAGVVNSNDNLNKETNFFSLN